MSATRSLEPARPCPAAVAVLLLAAPAAAEERLDIRARLDALGQRVERSVAAVIRPGPGPRPMQTPQAIHVAGVGVVVILPPRVLPFRPQVPSPPPPRPPAAPVAPAQPPVPPAPRPAPMMSGPEPVDPPVPVKPLEELERDLQRELAARARLLAELDRARLGDDEAFLRAIDLQMRALHEQAEAFRQEALRAREEAEREIRIRLRAAPPPSAPSAERPPEAPAPWGFWIQTRPRSPRSGEEVVAQVREAIVDSLPAQAKLLQGLDPRESVTVAVDLLSGARPPAAPAARRTLVVRVPVAELQAVATGRLTPVQFRQHVQSREY